MPEDQKIMALEAKIEELENKLQTLESFLSNPRVRIRDFEGLLKTLDSAPDEEYPDGSMVLVDLGGGDTRLYNRINGTWAYASLS